MRNDPSVSKFKARQPQPNLIVLSFERIDFAALSTKHNVGEATLAVLGHVTKESQETLLDVLRETIDILACRHRLIVANSVLYRPQLSDRSNVFRLV
ncbi:MAG TPA: hypothetical protein VG826_04110 [Pirellulales bacterium]|nr:hypothetical protein [Pirellulales bacterium]